MANDLNNVVLIGRLVRESELKYSKSGTAVCSFSLAVGEKYKDTENVSFFNCTLFGKSAEALHPYLNKGKQIGIVGKLKQDRWEDDKGKRDRVGIIVNSLQFLQNGKDEQKPSESKPKTTGPENFEEGDIPF